MSTRNQLDDLVARLQPVRDEDLASEARSADAQALFVRIVAQLDDDVRGSPPLHDPPRRRRPWLIAAVATVLAGVFALLAIDLDPAPEG